MRAPTRARAGGAALALLLAGSLGAGLGALACGRYGPPVRERPATPVDEPAGAADETTERSER